MRQDVGRSADRVEPVAERVRPAGLCLGPGHLVVHGNPAFRATFGERALGVPAREGMLDLSADAFAVLDAVYESGRPFARWIRRGGSDWRLTVAPRADPETGEVYGVRFHLRRRDDVPVLIERAEPNPAS